VCHPHQLETYGLIEFDQTKMPPCIESYTAHMLTARIIEKIIVKSRQDLEIIFIGGYTQQISLQ